LRIDPVGQGDLHAALRPLVVAAQSVRALERNGQSSGVACSQCCLAPVGFYEIGVKPLWVDISPIRPLKS
jgi:hypothetical protein